MQIHDSNLQICQKWYKTLAGQQALAQLDTLCKAYMEDIYGYYAVEIGALSGQTNFLRHTHIAFSATMGEDKLVNDIVATPEYMPLTSDDIDLVVATHVLETCSDPHKVLREIDRILNPHGEVIMIGFNPWSLMRSARALSTTVDLPGPSRVRDWFSLLGFEVRDIQYLGFRPGLQSEKLYRRLSWLEPLGKLAWPLFSNLYVIHAKKQVIARRPYKKVWQSPILLTGGKVALNRTAQRVRRENYSG